MKRELSELTATAQRLLAAGERGVFATLFASRGPTYRPLGALMVAGPPGVRAGGVSGGCLEDYVARVGRELTQVADAAVLHFDAEADVDSGRPALGCGGAIDVLVEPLTLAHVDFLRELALAFGQDGPSVFVTTLLTDATGKRGVSRRRAAPHEAPDVWATGRSRHDATPGGGTLAVYVPPVKRLVLLGAGDDVRPVCALAATLGWHVTVADRRARLATAARFPDADVLVADDWARVVPRLRLTPHTAVILMTHDPADDAALLGLLPEVDLVYLGVLGPAARLDKLRAATAAARPIHGPVGLDLGDRSAPGIAVSIIAGVMAAHRAAGANLPTKC